MEKLKKI